MIGCIVTTHNRPQALERSLPQITALGAPVLVVDDGSNSDAVRANAEICVKNGADQLWIPNNRGLATALNLGVSYWLADRSIKSISYFQDDCDAHPQLLDFMVKLQKYSPILTGHDARAHKSCGNATLDGIGILYKETCAGVHLFCSAEFWRGLLPFPTNELGTPKRIPGRAGRGLGSDCDWWVCRDAPRSSKARALQVIVVPNLVRTFNWQAEDSCWGNSQPWGEEPPLRA